MSLAADHDQIGHLRASQVLWSGRAEMNQACDGLCPGLTYRPAWRGALARFRSAPGLAPLVSFIAPGCYRADLNLTSVRSHERACSNRFRLGSPGHTQVC